MLPLMAVPGKQTVRMRKEKSEIHTMLKIGGISKVEIQLKGYFFFLFPF